jgi:large subunit ribosomal protein L17
MRKLGRTTDHRMAMLKNLATDLVTYEKIQTTEKRAKELRSYVEKLITKAKRANSNPGEVTKTSKETPAGSRASLGTNQLHAYRTIARKINKTKIISVDSESEEQVLEEINIILKIMDDLAVRFENTNGGYTRIIKMGPRRGDGSEKVTIEFTK